MMMSDSEKNILDIAAAGIALGSIADFLPSIAALLAIIWTGIRIYEWWRGKGAKE